MLLATWGCLVRFGKWVRWAVQLFLANAQTRTCVAEYPARRVVAYLTCVARESHRTVKTIPQCVNVFDASLIEKRHRSAARTFYADEMSSPKIESSMLDCKCNRKQVFQCRRVACCWLSLERSLKYVKVTRSSTSLLDGECFCACF